MTWADTDIRQWDVRNLKDVTLVGSLRVIDADENEIKLVTDIDLDQGYLHAFEPNTGGYHYVCEGASDCVTCQEGVRDPHTKKIRIEGEFRIQRRT